MGDEEHGPRRDSDLRTAAVATSAVAPVPTFAATRTLATRSGKSRLVIKKEPEDENDIKDYAETTMNELLGWFGYDKVNSRDTQGLNLNRYTGNDDGGEDEAARGGNGSGIGGGGGAGSGGGLAGECRRSRRNGSADSATAATAKDCLDILIGNSGEARATGSMSCATENSSGLDSPSGAGSGRTPTPPHSQTSPVNIPNGYVICAWCQKVGMKMFTLRTNNGVKAFCSELCFTQCRRASFKKYKVCDWCKHIRHTVNYVDFQDGEQQLQFCSDKCLNQYKMNIFCKEAQAHLQMHPHLQEAAKLAAGAAAANSSSSSSASGGAAGSGGNDALTLITPDLWLRDCKRQDDVSDDDDITYRGAGDDHSISSHEGDVRLSDNDNMTSPNMAASTNSNNESSMLSSKKTRRSFHRDYEQHHPNRNHTINEPDDEDDFYRATAVRGCKTTNVDELSVKSRTGSGKICETASDSHSMKRGSGKSAGKEEFILKMQTERRKTMDTEEDLFSGSHHTGSSKSSSINGCAENNDAKENATTYNLIRGRSHSGSTGGATIGSNSDHTVTNAAILDGSDQRCSGSNSDVSSYRHSRLRERRRHRHHHHHHHHQSTNNKKVVNRETENNVSSPLHPDSGSILPPPPPPGGSSESPPATNERLSYRNSGTTTTTTMKVGHSPHYRQTVRQSLLDRKSSRSTTAALQVATTELKINPERIECPSTIPGNASNALETVPTTTKSSVTSERHRSLLHKELADSLIGSGCSPPAPPETVQHHPADLPRYSLFRPKAMPATTSTHRPRTTTPEQQQQPAPVLSPHPTLAPSQQIPPNDLLIRAPLMTGMPPYHHHPHHPHHPPPFPPQIPADYFRLPHHHQQQHFPGIRPSPHFPFIFPPGMQFPIPPPQTAPPSLPTVPHQPPNILHQPSNTQINPNHDGQNQQSGATVPLQPNNLPLHHPPNPSVIPPLAKRPPHQNQTDHLNNNHGPAGSLLPPVTVMVPYPVMIPVPIPIPIPIPIPVSESQFQAFKMRFAPTSCSTTTSTSGGTIASQTQQKSELSVSDELVLATVLPPSPTRQISADECVNNSRSSARDISKRVDTVITRLVNSRMMTMHRPPKDEPEMTSSFTPSPPTTTSPVLRTTLTVNDSKLASTSGFITPNECPDASPQLSSVRIKDERRSPEGHSPPLPDRQRACSLSNSTDDTVAAKNDGRLLPEFADDDSRSSAQSATWRRSEDSGSTTCYSDGGRAECDESATCGSVPTSPASATQQRRRRRHQLVPFEDEQAMKRKCLRPRLLV